MAKSVEAYIKGRWQVSYSERSMTTLLAPIELYLKNPKLMPSKADAKAQLLFLRVCVCATASLPDGTELV